MNEITFTAEIDFPNRELAKMVATAWSRRTLRGYSLGPTKKDGTATLKLYSITPSERDWLDNQLQKINQHLGGPA